MNYNHLIELLNQFTNEKFTVNDIKPSGRQGSRAVVINIDNKYAIKTGNRDYENEKEALIRLKNCDFTPKIFGFDDDSRSIFMEWVKGEFLYDYIRNRGAIPSNFIDVIYKIEITLAENLCTDSDNIKWDEIAWNESSDPVAVKKVDFGQVECYGGNEGIQKLYERFKSDIHEKYKKLKDKDADEWNEFRRRLLICGIEKRMIDEYYNSL